MGVRNYMTQKLTDEEIVKALECCCKNDTCDGCPLTTVELNDDGTCVLFTKVYDLIHRAQDKIAGYERKLADGELLSKEWHDKQVFHDKAEIERLTEEKTESAKTAIEVLEQNIKLQKQVDELKERLHWIWAIGVDYDGCDTVESLKGLIDEMVEFTQMESKDLDELNAKQVIECYGMLKGCDMVKQAVKDTAKEILKEIVKLRKEEHGIYYSAYDYAIEIDKRVRKKYGVEVE